MFHVSFSTSVMSDFWRIHGERFQSKKKNQGIWLHKVWRRWQLNIECSIALNIAQNQEEISTGKRRFLFNFVYQNDVVVMREDVFALRLKLNVDVPWSVFGRQTNWWHWHLSSKLFYTREYVPVWIHAVSIIPLDPLHLPLILSLYYTFANVSTELLATSWCKWPEDIRYDAAFKKQIVWVANLNFSGFKTAPVALLSYCVEAVREQYLCVDHDI